jgi:hypothetical protein
MFTYVFSFHGSYLFYYCNAIQNPPPTSTVVTGDMPWLNRACAVQFNKEERHTLYSTLNITRVIKSRRITRAGHVARMGEMRNAYKILVEKHKED